VPSRSRCAPSRAGTASATARASPATGTHGAPRDDFEKAATYDEWGILMAYLYEKDGNAKWAGAYTSRADFHHKTNHRFHKLVSNKSILGSLV
jgi:hypothetical protein